MNSTPTRFSKPCRYILESDLQGFENLAGQKLKDLSIY